MGNRKLKVLLNRMVKGEFLFVIGQEGYVTLPAIMLISKHSFRVSLRLDRVGMFKVPRSVS